MSPLFARSKAGAEPGPELDGTSFTPGAASAEPEARRGADSDRTHIIGLIVGDVANPFYSTLHRAVEDVAASHNCAVIAASLDEDPQSETRIVSALLEHGVDGLIIAPAASSQAYLVGVQESGTNLVFVDRMPMGISSDTVISGNALGSRLAVKHLTGYGHQRIAFLGDRGHLWTEQERERGFEEGMLEAGIKNPLVIRDLPDEMSAYDATRDLMRSADPPTALYTSQNLITIGAIRSLQALGLQRQIALMGFDDIPTADLIRPGVSVIAQDAYAIGETAAESLFNRIDGFDGPAVVTTIPVNLIARGSGEISLANASR